MTRKEFLRLASRGAAVSVAASSMPRITARAAGQAAAPKVAHAAGTTAAVVNFIAGARLDGVPANVVAEAKRCLIDGFGVVLAGSTVQGSAIVREYVKSTYPRAGPRELRVEVGPHEPVKISAGPPSSDPKR